jgi:acyl transferase domain-containing protein
MIQGRVIIPGALFLEGARRASEVNRALSRVTFLAAGEVNGEAEINLQSEGDKFHFVFNDRELCRGHFGPDIALDESISPSSLSGGTNETPGDRVYADLAAMGYAYGPSLRPIEKCWQTGKQLVCEMHARDTGLPPEDRDAALVDGFFQGALYAAITNGVYSSGQAVLVPFYIGYLQKTAILPDRVWLVVDLSDLEARGEDLQVRRARAFDRLGNCVCRIDNLHVKRYSNKPEFSVYEPVWIRREMGNSHQIPGLAIVAGGDAHIHKALATKLTEKGIIALESASDVAGSLRGNQELCERGIHVYYLGLSTVTESLEGLFQLTKDLSHRLKKHRVRLIVATQGAQFVLPDDGVEEFRGAGLASLAQVAAHEHQRWSMLAVDLPGRMEPQEVADLLVKEGCARNADEFVARRSSGRYVRSIQPATATADHPSCDLREDGVYLITGGLGRAGDEITRSMARLARPTLVLINRSSVEPHDHRLETLRNLGARVEYRAADVADRDRMREVLTEIRRVHGPITGVVHAAGLVEDRSIAMKEWESFRRVLRPKLDGALVLDELTASEPLDFFIVFSSLSSVVGNPGQCDYACANAALDAFVRHRTAVGRCGISASINWTAWKDVGMAARGKVNAGLIEMAGLLHVEAALAGFYDTLKRGSGQWVITAHPMEFGARLPFKTNIVAGERLPDDAVAIVGMAGRFPGAADPDALWEHLAAGHDLISEIPHGRPDAKLRAASDLAIWQRGGFLDDIDAFDAPFFHVSAREAELMDPQQRLMLEIAWHTIENAGYQPRSLAGSRTGVFIGVSNDDYRELLGDTDDDAHCSTGNSFCLIPNRISYLLNLRGPSFAVDTACSSSLVAFHQAMSAIRNKECEAALVGGVNLCSSPSNYIWFQKARMLSPDQRCKAFGAEANGYVRAEAAGAVLLKPLTAALADGDHIYAVVRASGVNHGGAATSLTAPNHEAQRDLLLDVYGKAGVPVETITYLEAHGTGTKLGDSSEIAALKEAFHQLSRQSVTNHSGAAYCGVGSVKSNIGHSESAAGISGIIKVLLSLEHKVLPPSLHSRPVNSLLGLEESPFFIVHKAQPWMPLTDSTGTDLPRRAGVNSFGFGGANAHVLLEEFRTTSPESEYKEAVVILSAGSSELLAEYVQRVKSTLHRKVDRLCIGDVAWTLQTGRESRPCRLAFVATTMEEAIRKLDGFLQGTQDAAAFFSGTVPPQGGDLSLLNDDQDFAAWLEGYIRKGKLQKLAELWVKGVRIDWKALHEGARRQRVPLPGVPFERHRYWLSQTSHVARPTAAERPQVKAMAASAGQGFVPRPSQPTVAPVVRVSQPPAALPVSSAHSVEDELASLISDLLRVPAASLDHSTDFTEFGVDSIISLDILTKLEERYDCILEPDLLARCDNIRSLAAHLIGAGIGATTPGPGNAERQESEATDTYDHPAPEVIAETTVPGPRLTQTRAIAVVGMACRFPLSENLDQFWQNLTEGRRLFREVPRERWDVTEHYSPNKNSPGRTYSKWGGFIDGIDLFDCGYFGLSADRAGGMDPQQRILLELTQHLLDDAGYQRKDAGGRAVGVFLGAGDSRYMEPGLSSRSDGHLRHCVVDNIANMTAGRLADFYDLRGPALTMDTACSSSLVSIHQACQSIRFGECEMAVSGGVELLIGPDPFVAFSKAGVLSDDPHCYVFDERAKGFVLGEGAGLILMKDLETALRDGDLIRGVIRGSAINNDGHTMGITTPDLDAQRTVIQRALEMAETHPREITYLEAHGTGTLLGDPIEIKAATEAFGGRPENHSQWCGVGTVKSNMGHLLRAAGVASFIKTVLALGKRTIPPTIDCYRPHPRFQFESSPFYPVTRAETWKSGTGRRRASISSFGFGGTNCHMVVEEAADAWRSAVRRSKLPPTPFCRDRCWREAAVGPEDPVLSLLGRLASGEVTLDDADHLIAPMLDGRA